MLAYVFLVILPVLGLVGILKSGRSLNAPFSVDGTWKIDTGASHGSVSPCADLLSTVSSAPVSISQSGKTLVVGLNGGAKTTTGLLEGKTINASFAGTDTKASDCADRSLTFTATLDPQAEPRTIIGTLSVDGCTSCAPLEFRAVRQPRSANGGPH